MLAWRSMGRRFTVKTCVGVTQQSALTGAMPRRTGFAALAMNPTLAPHHRPGGCVAF